MLANTYHGPGMGQNVTGWLMSEKLDGVRALWTGSELLSRNGNRFAAPAWFTAQLPAGIPLDGELFLGRGKFQTTVGIVRKKTPADSDWSAMRYHVFDAPAATGGFAARLAYAAEVIAASPVAELVEHRPCTSEDALEEMLADVCCAGGEGIMLRDPASAYEPRRSSSLLKYKPFDSDEAEMVGQESGDGKFSGMVGALVLKWKNLIFRVGSGLPDCLRQTPPPVGSRITFGFCGYTDAGLPRFPTFLCCRDYE
jgi:DNA ligase 1